MLADTARDLLVNFDKPLLHPRRMSVTKAHHIKKLSFINSQGRNMVYGLSSKPKIWMGSGIRGKGSGLKRMGSGITRLLSPNQGSNLLHGLKISWHNIFPHNKVCVHRISWPRYITYSCFRLAAVPVIRSPGCLTKTWYHILNLFNCWGHCNMNLKSLFSLCNATPQRAVNARRQRKRFIHIFFCEKWGRRKRTKRNPVTEKGT